MSAICSASKIVLKLSMHWDWEDTPPRRIRHAVKNSNAEEVKDFIAVAICFVDLKIRDCDPFGICLEAWYWSSSGD